VARADEDASVEILAVDGVREGAHVLDSNVAFRAEFHPQGADGCRLIGGWGVLLDHARAGVGLEGEVFADWTTFAIAVLVAELFEGYCDFFFGDFISSIFGHFVNSSPGTPKA
jgi:hypothetical protein